MDVNDGILTIPLKCQSSNMSFIVIATYHRLVEIQLNLLNT